MVQGVLERRELPILCLLQDGHLVLDLAKVRLNLLLKQLHLPFELTPKRVRRMVVTSMGYLRENQVSVEDNIGVLLAGLGLQSAVDCHCIERRRLA